MDVEPLSKLRQWQKCMPEAGSGGLARGKNTAGRSFYHPMLRAVQAKTFAYFHGMCNTG
jgi:hypothetical protein